MMTAPPNKSGPSCNEEEESGGEREERRSVHLKEEEKKKKRRRKQTPVADKPVCLQRTKKIISRFSET